MKAKQQNNKCVYIKKVIGYIIVRSEA